MNLTKNFYLDEMLASQSAVRLGFDEQFTPDQAVIDNLRALCLNVLQPLRDGLQRAILTSSGYRCPRVNQAIGGAKTSQHLFGMAADINVGHLTTEQLYQRIKKSGLVFDQLIQEFDRWVHVSYNPDLNANRRQCLRAVKENGATRYIPD
ncbi:D-Ala-D-Ala carboxypeptidase family metallohydrolase [Aquiflexum gelatinilyticum]|uniref:D-Ala-D-Ala carboxypeptidase family metallohydrolase n=1 Tax=Aquiflexum gelatinilyticum TaxID=2961943 RepID=A0A9X2P420_9BACT|nr:D-Ala-D-Ala carboxypeptidase family metallohydrolase [Aquiflexum gelatinilyticum]MCR9015518.1 D-Ala-D-Ala carboxypeptidase family metallohydrolase [Aquiflexum gelatinilyticum]